MEEGFAEPTFSQSLSHITSGFGSPITSHWMMTVSPSQASVDLGFVKNLGSLEYLEKHFIFQDIEYIIGNGGFKEIIFKSLP